MADRLRADRKLSDSNSDVQSRYTIGLSKH